MEVRVQVGVELEFKADKKEPLGEMVRRVLAAFDAAGLPAVVGAAFTDGPLPGGVSAVERALKKYPELAAWEVSGAVTSGMPAIRALSSTGGSAPMPMESVLALADGMPRSLPFHNAVVSLSHDAFGHMTTPLSPEPSAGGIAISDSWWINGRNRGLRAVYVVEGDGASKRLPEPPDAVAVVLGALGKPKKTRQFVLPAAAAATGGAPAPAAPQVPAIVARYRAEIDQLLDRIALPHGFPPLQEALRQVSEPAGPLKPALVEAFGPRGFDCRGESGTFTLRRRTPANHVLELYLDVGTWSRMVTAIYRVHAPGFVASVPIPVGPGAGGQYPIGDQDNWRRIVANLDAITGELDRTFAAEVEAAAGPAPEWFQPGS